MPTRSDPADAAAHERRARREGFARTCDDLHRRLSANTEGARSSYIPELATVDPDHFAIAAVTADDLATFGATLANHGIHPETGERVVSAEVCRDMLTIAFTCGMYDCADEWAFSVGIPPKSGVGGGIVGMLPGVGGVAVFSPRLDEYGNSVRGLRVFEEVSRTFAMHLHDPDHPWRAAIGDR